MIIFRYLLTEVAKAQAAVFLVLMTIFVSQKFVLILGDASDGSIPGHLLMLFIALKIPDLAGMMLPLSLFLGVLLAYGRIYADSEMTVLHACGVSELYVVRITLILGLCTAILTGVFTLYLAPLASNYESSVKQALAADAGLSTLVAGRFQKTSNKKAVVFIHSKNSEDNTLDKVFVAQLPTKEDTLESVINSSIVYAKEGQVIEDENGSQRLILGDGMRYQHSLKSNEYSEVTFDKYYIEIKDNKIEQKRVKISAIDTPTLLETDSPENSAAIHWRFAFPLACIVLIFTAVPLSRVNPRQGKFGKMLPALLLFLAYFLLLTAMRSTIESGIVSSLIGLWPVHLLAFVLGTLLIAKDRKSAFKLRAKLSNSSRMKEAV